VSGGYFLDFVLKRDALASPRPHRRRRQRHHHAAVGGQEATTRRGRERYGVAVRYATRELRDDPERLGRVLVALPAAA